jgi:hypothetical protein
LGSKKEKEALLISEAIKTHRKETFLLNTNLQLKENEITKLQESHYYFLEIISLREYVKIS